MRIAKLLVSTFVVAVLGLGPQGARAQAAVGYGAAVSSSATASVGASKVYSAVPKTIGSQKAVVRSAQPAGSGAGAANKTSRRNPPARVPTQETQARADVTGTTARPLGTREAGLTVLGAEPRKPQ